MIVQLTALGNEGFGLVTNESVMVKTPIILNVTGGMY